MSPDVLKEMLDRVPFEPFRVCLSNGSAYDVTNPDMVALMKSKAFIALPNSEKWSFVSYLHIAALEALTGRSGNGRTRKPRR